MPIILSWCNFPLRSSDLINSRWELIQLMTCAVLPASHCLNHTWRIWGSLRIGMLNLQWPDSMKCSLSVFVWTRSMGRITPIGMFWIASLYSSYYTITNPYSNMPMVAGNIYRAVIYIIACIYTQIASIGNIESGCGVTWLYLKRPIILLGY